jgi:hypothetical protein
MREKKKKTTERRRGPHFREKTRTDYDDDETLPRRESRCVQNNTTRKQKEIFGERSDDENTSFGPPSPALEAITFTTA